MMLRQITRLLNAYMRVTNTQRRSYDATTDRAAEVVYQCFRNWRFIHVDQHL